MSCEGSGGNAGTFDEEVSFDEEVTFDGEVIFAEEGIFTVTMQANGISGQGVISGQQFAGPTAPIVGPRVSFPRSRWPFHEWRGSGRRMPVMGVSRPQRQHPGAVPNGPNSCWRRE